MVYSRLRKLPDSTTKHPLLRQSIKQRWTKLHVLKSLMGVSMLSTRDLDGSRSLPRRMVAIKTAKSPGKRDALDSYISEQ